MCGICLILKIDSFNLIQEIKKYNLNYSDAQPIDSSSKSNMNDSLEKLDALSLFKALSKRGPDYQSYLLIENINTTEPKVNNNFVLDENNSSLIKMSELIEKNSVLLMNSVLNLRGIHGITKQPLFNEKTANVLQYNGEIFNILNSLNEKEKEIENNHNLYLENDGIILNEMLNEFSIKIKLSNKDKVNDEENYVKEMFRLINSLDSDHSFIFHDYLNKKIIISRDLFGKRSLLLCFIPKLGLSLITSCVPESFLDQNVELTEIPANHIILISTAELQNEDESFPNIKLIRNPFIEEPSTLRFKDTNFNIQNNFENSNSNSNSNINQELIYQSLDLHLEKAVDRRIEMLNDNNIAILFSGGLDSLILAYYTCKIISKLLNQNEKTYT